jgi:ParB-like chromosome segregation protein Spo0J
VLPTADIVPYSRNSRTHSREQIAAIAASIRQFGFTNPLLVDESSVLIAGHGRLAAAQQLGMTELPAIVLAGLSETQKQALRIADNKLALNAGWDDDLLRTELMDLRDGGFDLALTGFGDQELEQLFAPELDRLDEWEGMPEFEADNRIAHRSIVIHFRTQQAVDAFAALIGQPITAITRSAWFPQLEIARLAEQRFTTDEPEFSDLHSI